MPPTLQEKIEAEQRFREFLKDYDLPEPDGVEYGNWCIWFRYDDRKVVVKFNLDPNADPEPGEILPPGR